MALDLVVRHTSKSANTIGSGTYTTASFTPRNNSLLIVVAQAMSDGVVGSFDGSNITLANSASLTMTAIGNTSAAPSWYYGARAWRMSVGTGASMTISLDAGTTSIISYAVTVYDITGHDTTTPIAGFIAGSDADGNGSHSITLAATPASGDIAIGGVAVQLSGGDNTVTVGTGWTEDYDTTENSWYGFQTQRRTGSTSTTVTWDDLSATGTPVDAVSLAFIVKAAAAGGATLTADAGSFTLSGQAATLQFDQTLVAAAGSFTLTGQAATLRRGISMSAASGSFTLSGQAATTRQGYVLTAAAGSFALTGSDAARDLSMSAAAGSFTLTGQDATLTPSGGMPVLTAEAGAFTLSGQAATLRAGRVLAFAAGSFTLTGQPATLLTAHRIAADAGAFSLTGQNATLTPDVAAILTAEAGTFTLTGGSADLIAPRRDTGAGSSRRRRRYVVTIDGQDFIVESEAHARALLDRAAELAEKAAAEVAEQAAERALPKARRIGRAPQIKVEAPTIQAPPELRDLAREAQARIERVYASAARDAEIALLLKWQQELEDEETLLLLM